MVSAPTTIAAGAPAPSSPSRRWHWPPYPLTWAVAGCVLVAAFMANFPAVDVSRVRLEGPFGLTRTYAHGWPARFLTRDAQQPKANASVRGSWPMEPAPAWQPWRNVEQFHITSLLVDAAIWTAALLLATAAAQSWRSRRRAVWQLQTVDLFGLVTVAAVICGWIAAQRFEHARERALVARAVAADGPSEKLHVDSAAAVPAFLSESQQGRYRQCFERVATFASYGQSDLACQFRHVLVLKEARPGPEFHQHLAQMPQLEALDLSMASLRYYGARRQFTIHDLPPMPNLRRINLDFTAATDADMTWLSKCPRLEAIELADTKVGDEGIQHLRTLPRLRRVMLTSKGVTDEGCRRLADFPALEELSLAGRNIHDEGVRELARLPKVRVLWITASASEEALSDLRKALPACEVITHRYP